MSKYVAAYLATLVVFFALDFVWLSIMGNALYKPTLGDILLPKFSPAPALIFYVLYIVGVVIFAIVPAIQSGNWTSALLFGALFGFFAYGTYDMTNMSTLRNWTLQITVADMIWGTVLTGVSASAGYVISKAALRAFGMAS
ncbi:DUF2177 family protein [Beijerinckia sp. L45]|uniref:DUF2177 family protein n=1 Tax=Beijerinckia sp. L45 TaxID=1641855 RepID=UPI00131CD3C3|nr:DUF2177 family protein [Beijerinckia sp. L45]